MKTAKGGISPKNNKKLKKEVKASRKIAAPLPEEAKVMIMKDIESKHEKKNAKARKTIANKMTAIQKTLKMNKAKTTSSKKSKRTNHEEGIVGTVPAHVHSEGKRWIKTLKKQTKEKNIVFRKKATKTSKNSPVRNILRSK